MGKVEMVVDSESMRIILEEMDKQTKFTSGSIRDAYQKVSKAYIKAIPIKLIGEK